jgi:hypothetical protein
MAVSCFSDAVSARRFGLAYALKIQIFVLLSCLDRARYGEAIWRPLFAKGVSL